MQSGMNMQSGSATPGRETSSGYTVASSGAVARQCRWLGDAPTTPMGQLPTMNTPLASTCTQSGGTLQPVAINTDPQNYYTAGYKCCTSMASLFPPIVQSGSSMMQSGMPTSGNPILLQATIAS